MYSQSVLRPSPANSFRSSLGKDCEMKSTPRSYLPKPQGSPRKLGDKVGFKVGSKLPHPPTPSRIIPREQKEQLLKKLTPVQYKVTQEKVTERPFSNQYYKHFETGLYSCVVCSEPLFQSQTKYDSKSGWPAFYDILDETKVTYKQDLSHLGANLLLLVCNPSLARIEVSCTVCGAHLGHVFDDGPKPTGKRFCVNSAALQFAPVDSEKIESLKRAKENRQRESEREDEDPEKRKKKEDTVDHLSKTDKDKKSDPLIHLASPANSCAMGAQICFRVPNANPALS